MKIMDMAERSLTSYNPSTLYEEIKSLALAYGLMSKFTAFIAVDAAGKTAGGHGYTVAQARVRSPRGAIRHDGGGIGLPAESRCGQGRRHRKHQPAEEGII